MSSAESPRALVDMDGVLADFDGRVLEIASNDIPDFVPQPRRNFYIADDYPEDQRAQIRAISNQQGFFASLQPTPHFLEGWQRIIEAESHPVICTSPLRANPWCVSEKRLWIERHIVPEFGQQVLDEAIIDRNKGDYPGIALIDDRPDIPDSTVGAATWRHVLFSTAANEQALAELRLSGWRDPNLELILSHCRKVSIRLGRAATV